MEIFFMNVRETWPTAGAGRSGVYLINPEQRKMVFVQGESVNRGGDMAAALVEGRRAEWRAKVGEASGSALKLEGDELSRALASMGAETMEEVENMENGLAYVVEYDDNGEEKEIQLVLGTIIPQMPGHFGILPVNPEDWQKF